MTSAALADIVGYLDRYLRIGEVPDETNAVNGLQVENASGRVAALVAAVDASQATIDGIAGDGPVLLLVHHGLFWDGNLPVTGRRYRRLARLLAKEIAVYSAHIPLDVHPEVGNNALLARALGLVNLSEFDNYRGIPLGIVGEFPHGLARDLLVGRLNELLGSEARLIAGGPELARSVGIITGAGGSRIATARAAGADTFITGEGAHHTYFDAMELGLNVIYAGHYATEQGGIKALAEHLGSRFGLPWEFHDHPTGL
jgi:dinuclear metal center YbgI/SA1388 family protein